MRFANQKDHRPGTHTSQSGGEKLIIIVLIRWTGLAEAGKEREGITPETILFLPSPAALLAQLKAPQIVIKAAPKEKYWKGSMCRDLLKPCKALTS